MIDTIREIPLITFFLFGFLGGLVGKAFVYFIKIENENASIRSGIYYAVGITLSGLMGGLLAIVIDKQIQFSIVVGIFTEFVYLLFLRKIRNFIDKII